MPTRAPQAATVPGAALTMYDAAADDKVSGISRPTRVIVHNTTAGAVTLDVDPPGNTDYGVPNPVKQWTIPVGYHSLLLIPSMRNPADSNLITLTWSATGSTLKWAAVG